MLQSPTDRALGEVYKIIPEWNIRDITKPNSDYLLDHLKHRATTSLTDQYAEGVNGGPGDAAFIQESMRVHHLRHARTFRHSFTLFAYGEEYGRSYTVSDSAKYQQVMAGMSSAVEAGICVPQSTGQLILVRQLYLLQALNILVDDILEQCSTVGRKARSTETEKAALPALSSLSLEPSSDKLSLGELAAHAADRMSALKDHDHLFHHEPEYLVHVVNAWFSSRPELVPDESGRILPQEAGKNTGIAMFQALHSAIFGIAIWQFICQLLQALIHGPRDQAYRRIVLQELANMVCFEYQRVQSQFKRHFQVCSGSRHFKRISGVYDDSTPRVSPKTKPELVATKDPYLYYMLRLCQTDSTPSKAVDRIKGLHDLFQSDSTQRARITQQEFDALSDLAATTSFAQYLSASLPMPSACLKKDQNPTYMRRLKDRFTKLEGSKHKVDIITYAVPINNLLEPGMAEAALNAIHECLFGIHCSDIRSMYQMEHQIGLSGIEHQYRQHKAGPAPAAPDLSAPPSPAPGMQIPPAVASMLSTTTSAEDDPAPVSLVFKTKLSVYNVFWTLFSKTGARGSITWAAFEAAMIHVGFTVVPGLGSVYTFCPPNEYNAQQAITLHRPLTSQIEGCCLLMIRRRLGEKYGWGEKSFEMAVGW
ncbi:hypothetical protein ASPCADRAFT_179201 [Aspergillus carbonarius ITEM 5010]|uniref:Uncharacterized protein n=1 Tax=Aspergillus carbonarius (strain ITEM 5010) TaxID=602072 RepID=A0A1R3R783_ASPC5|nr:hypothetical protein ASPCADRAFT_179201 [Aspergillus carbonarius ITEM 5010]